MSASSQDAGVSRPARVPAPVQWAEGMLLTPQHLQQNDIYWHSLLWQMMQTRPHAFGVLRMSVDTAALQKGEVRVKSLHCVMPDGLLVDYPSSEVTGVLETRLKPEDFREGRPMTVYLTVPRRVEGAACGSNDGRRFEHLDGQLEIDENTGEGQAPVSRLAPRLSLQAGDGVDTERNVAMALMEVRLNAGGVMELSAWHPPLLRIGASDFQPPLKSLHGWLQRLNDGLRIKVKELAGRSGMSSELGRLMAALPVLELTVDSPEMHPFDAYMALAQVSGLLAPLSGEAVPRKLPRYDHLDPRACFAPVVDRLLRILARLTLPRSRQVFAEVEPPCGVFLVELADDVDADDLIIELVPREGQARQSLERWIGRARIGASDLIPDLTRRRETGAAPVRPDARDLEALRLANTDNVYRLSNASIQIGDAVRPALQSGAVLQVAGPDNADVPAQIVLWLARPPLADGAAVSALD